MEDIRFFLKKKKRQKKQLEKVKKNPKIQKNKIWNKETKWSLTEPEATELKQTSASLLGEGGWGEITA